MGRLLWRQREEPSAGPRQALHLLRSSDTQSFPRGTVRIVAGRRSVRAHKVSEDKESRKQVFEVLAAVKDACESLAVESPGQLSAVPALQVLLDRTLKTRLNPPGGDYRFKFDVIPLAMSEEAALIDAMDAALAELRVPMGEGDTSSVDTPITFDARNLVDLTGVIAAGMQGDAQSWIAPMQDRLGGGDERRQVDKRLRVPQGRESRNLAHFDAR